MNLGLGGARCSEAVYRRRLLLRGSDQSNRGKCLISTIGGASGGVSTTLMTVTGLGK